VGVLRVCVLEEKEEEEEEERKREEAKHARSMK
jgi:hypothetical protein